MELHFYPQALIDWYKTLDVNILNGYGMTENCCVCSYLDTINIEGKGSVGIPWDAVDIKIGDEGEIWTKSPYLLKEYYKNKELTAEVMKDGWFNTGDKGYLDDKGYLFITGRVKDIFKTAKGEYISPSTIEMKLSVDNYIEQVCIVGRGLTQPIAIITLSSQSKNFNKIELEEYFKNSLISFNENMVNYEKISKFVILKKEWTVENNFLTPSMKIKRNTIERAYSDKYFDWDSSSQTVISDSG